MSSKILGWRTRIYVLYTSTYPEALNTTIWATPLKVPQGDILFGFAYWHNLASIREEWHTYDMIGIVSAEQCNSAFIAHVSKTLADDTLLKNGYHQFTMGETTRKYSELFQRKLKALCVPPMPKYVSRFTYNAWLCSSAKMDRFIDWFSAKLIPFISAKPLGFDDLVKVGDSMKVNGGAIPYAQITTMIVEQLILGYFATDPIDDKMNSFYTIDYEREAERLAQHEQLKLHFIKSVDSLPKLGAPVANTIQLLQDEYREKRAAREQIEAEELAARESIDEEMKLKAIKETELLATLQQSMVASNTSKTLAEVEFDALRQKVEAEISRERLQAEVDASQYRKSMDEELAAMRRKAEEHMLASIRAAELESIKQIQLQTEASITRIREDTERKVAVAKSTLERDKLALERAKRMHSELEVNRASVIREAEEAVQQMRTIEKETRKYTQLLEQAQHSRKRYEAEKTMLVEQINVEMSCVRSTIEQMDTIYREKEQRIRKTREEVESKFQQALIKGEKEAAELRKQNELIVLAERQRLENNLREELRPKEDEYLANKRREDAILEADIRAKRAEYLKQKKQEDDRILSELKEKEILYSQEHEQKLAQLEQECDVIKTMTKEAIQKRKEIMGRLSELEKPFHEAVAAHKNIQVYSDKLIEETAILKARYEEKVVLERKSAEVLSLISVLEQDLSALRADTRDKETFLTRLLEEKQATLLKRSEIVVGIPRAKYNERIRMALNEMEAAKRPSTGQHPVKIYILCHTTERFIEAASIYKYPWAHPILMKYQDCTFENAIWRQLYELRDEWYNYKMVGTLSFTAYKKINLDTINRIVQDPATWDTGFHHFMRTNNPITNKNHPYLVEIMTDVCRDLELRVPPGNFCNYWIASAEKMLQFLIWFEERAYPVVMSHPLIMTDATYPGALTKEQLMTLCGVPYYPHAPFVFERLFLSFFTSLV
jgi:hypothetical protein